MEIIEKGHHGFMEKITGFEWDRAIFHCIKRWTMAVAGQKVETLVNWI